MAEPLQDHPSAEEDALLLVAREAVRYLGTLPDAPVKLANADHAAAALDGPLPENGDGALATLRKLLADGLDAATRSSGPRFFPFVMGGTTTAALGADWIAAALDQNVGSWVSSPLGTQLEVISLDWLKELFDLPASWGGVLT